MRLLWLAGAVVVLGAGCGIFREAPAPEAAALTLPEAEFGRALAHFAHGLIVERESATNNAAAIDSFKAAAALDGTDPILTDVLVGRLWAHGRSSEALTALRRRCDQFPSEECFAVLAGMAEELGRDDLAIDSYGKAAVAAPDAAYRWRSQQTRILIRRGEDKRALRILRKMGREASSQGLFEPSMLWGQQLLRLESKKERAKPFFELALAAATNHKQRAVAYQGVFMAEWAAGHTNAARRALAHAADEEPGKMATAAGWARFELATRGAGVTNMWQRQARQARPDPNILLALSQLAAADKRYQEASALMERAEDIFVKRRKTPDASFYSRRGYLLELAGQVDLAEAKLRAGLKALPNSDLLRNHLAYLLAVANRELAEAEELVLEALRVEPDNGAYRDTLGWVYYRQERYEEARKELVQAIRQAGENPVILDHLGDVALALGNSGEALEYWRRSLLKGGDESVADKINAHSRRAP